MFQRRISPLFDEARQLLVVDIEQGTEIERRQVRVDQTETVARARRVEGLDAQVLICGAISRPLEAMLASFGIWVIPNTCGPVEEVLKAFISNEFERRSFLMPGCCGRRRRVRGRNRRGGRWS